jgi:hypothetical protein
MPGTPSSDKGGIVEKKDMLDRLIADGTVELTCLTDEEMASINADEQTPFRPASRPHGSARCPRTCAPRC